MFLNKSICLFSLRLNMFSSYAYIRKNYNLNRLFGVGSILKSDKIEKNNALVTINYFQYYNLKERLDIDKEVLRKLFCDNSKKYHPDSYTLESEKEQEDFLAKSTINNEAYRTLIDDELKTAGNKEIV